MPKHTEDQAPGTARAEVYALCPACGFDRHSMLPAIGEGRSMLSDGRSIAKPLQKLSCRSCGFGFHRDHPSEADLRGFYDAEYSLGQRDFDAERARAHLYAAAISKVLEDLDLRRPSRIMELGCGMGSLLATLSAQWSCALSVGVEPSDQLVQTAQSLSTEHLKFQQGFAEDVRVDAVGRFDLCFSVNVIEHTLDPERFLQACASLLTTEGLVVVVCPAGDAPNLELLFHDHISSFAGHAMYHFAQRAGLCILHQADFADQLEGFQIFVMRKGESKPLSTNNFEQLIEDRRDFLGTWETASQRASELLSKRAYYIFGMGEYADLLAVYCPQITSKAEGYVVDTPQTHTFKGKPVVSVDALSDTAKPILLAAVHPRSWNAVKQRFSELGYEVVHPLLSA